MGAIRDTISRMDVKAYNDAVAQAKPHRELKIPDDRHLGTFWLVAPGVGQALDATSTLIVLHSLKGSHEGNGLVAPIVSRGLIGEAVFVGGKLAVGGFMAYAGARLHEGGHQGWARVFSGGATALGVGAAVHNFNLLR